MSSLPRIAADGSVSYVDERGLTAASYVPTTYTEKGGDVTEVQPKLPLPITDLIWQIRRGNTDIGEINHKFGSRYSLGAAYEPVTSNAVYNTPKASGAIALRIKAGGNVNDTAAGSGAREVTIQGLDETGSLATEAVATAGASASSATTTTFMRQFRSWVSASGAYASTSVASQAAEIVIEDTGSTEWSIIDATDIAKCQSQIAMYSVPLGRTAYITTYNVTSDALKSVDYLMFKREGILDTVAPYQARRIVTERIGIQGALEITPKAPLGPYPALTDIGWLARSSASSPNVSVDFEIVEFYV